MRKLTRRPGDSAQHAQQGRSSPTARFLRATSAMQDCESLPDKQARAAATPPRPAAAAHLRRRLADEELHSQLMRQRGGSQAPAHAACCALARGLAVHEASRGSWVDDSPRRQTLAEGHLHAVKL